MPYANVNLDMVGRNDAKYLEMTPSPEHEHTNALAQAAIELAPSEGFDPPTYVDRDFERSDQASFAEGLGLPVVYLSAGEHPDYTSPATTSTRSTPTRSRASRASSCACSTRCRARRSGPSPARRAMSDALAR